jgi:hypothetical protein
MMIRNRSKRQRPVSFEALEGRLALSTGVGMAEFAGHRHALAMIAQIRASFKGHVQVTGATTISVTGLHGRIGADQMTGSGTGTVAGRQFQGGTVSLSNSLGTVELGLGAAFKVRRRQDVPVVVLAATGKYAPFVNLTGTLTKWNVPARPTGTASFAGSFA